MSYDSCTTSSYGSSTSAGDWHYFPSDNSTSIDDSIINISPFEFDDSEETKEKLKQLEEKLKQMEEQNKTKMRSLFKVYVVDPRKNGVVLLDGKLVIAKDKNQAILKAGVAAIADEAGLDLEQVDIHAEHIAEFIREKKETQKVKVVKDDEDDS